MWPHFVSLLSQIWTNLLNSLGTTTLAIISFMVAAPVVTFLVTTLYLYPSHPHQGLLARLQGTLVPTLIGFVTPIVILVVLFAWRAVKTVYNDHQDLAARNVILLQKNSVLQSENKTTKDKVDQQQQEIARLSEEKRGNQQKNNDQLDITMHLNPTEPNLQVAQNAKQLLMLTNKTIPSPHLRLVCDGDMVRGSAFISGAGIIIGGSHVVGKRVVDVSIESPAWTPKSPLLVTLYYNDPNQITECAVQGSITP
jgi:hypothetical protein